MRNMKHCYKNIKVSLGRVRIVKLMNIAYVCGPGSSVGIATDYGLDGPGSNPGADEIFPPVQAGPGSVL